MRTFAIDPEFLALMPPLSANEFDQLEANILSKGCRDAVLIWEGHIVDGHNRFAICQKHGLPFEVRDMDFGSREQAKFWILGNQLGRRNLTDAQRIELAKGKIELGRKIEGECRT